jgi:hypothetical protein
MWQKKYDYETDEREENVLSVPVRESGVCFFFFSLSENGQIIVLTIAIEE